MAYLELKNVIKEYHSEAGNYRALNSVNFALENGEFDNRCLDFILDKRQIEYKDINSLDNKNGYLNERFLYRDINSPNKNNSSNASDMFYLFQLFNICS